MLYHKKLVALSAVCGLVICCLAATRPPKYKNLQILPKDISEKKMDSIMESYSKALNVGCDFCHSKAQNFPDSLDFAADNNHMKTDARKMMRLVIDINTKYFNYTAMEHPIYLTAVNCMTCHRGEPIPTE